MQQVVGLLALHMRYAWYVEAGVTDRQLCPCRGRVGLAGNWLEKITSKLSADVTSWSLACQLNRLAQSWLFTIRLSGLDSYHIHVQLTMK